MNGLLEAWAQSIQAVTMTDYVRWQTARRWGLPAYEWCKERWCRHDR